MSDPQLPRERLLNGAANSMLDEELLAVLLSTGAEGSNHRALAALVMQHFGGLAGVLEAGPGELLTRRGIGPAKASRLLAAAEIWRRMAARQMPVRATCPSPKELFNEYLPRLGAEAQEHLIGIFVDSRGRRFGDQVLCIGGLSGALVHPRDVYRPVIRAAAAAVILLHNHPSGDPTPSQSDIDLTNTLQLAGELLGIRLLDHVIIGHEGFRSIASMGLLSSESRAA